MDELDWRPEKSFLSEHKALVSTLAVMVLVAVAVAGVFYLVSANSKPAPKAPEPEPILNNLEERGVSAALADFSAKPREARGTIKSGTIQVTVQLTYGPDQAIGFGTITAGQTSAHTYLDRGDVYIQGAADFWSAVAVTGVDPARWVKADKNFLDGGLFLSADTVVETLRPTSAARLRGLDYSVNGSTARFNAAADLVSFHVGSASYSILPADPASPRAGATPMLVSNKTPTQVMQPGAEDHSWAIATPPPAPKPTSGADSTLTTPDGGSDGKPSPSSTNAPSTTSPSSNRTIPPTRR